MKTKLLQYGITTAILAVCSLLIMVSKDLFIQTNLKEIYKILTDSFFVPGVVAVCFGLLIVASNEGTFYIFSYGMKSFLNLFKKDRSKMHYKTYYDYKEAMKDNKKPYGFILLVGLVFTAISLIFTVLWLQIAK